MTRTATIKPLGLIALGATAVALALASGLISFSSLEPRPGMDARAVLPLGTIGYVDLPEQEVISSESLLVRGWALDPAGIREVALNIDGTTAPARLGLPRSDVAASKASYPGSAAAGFEIEKRFDGLRPLRYAFSVVAVNGLGVEHLLARKSLLAPGAMDLWRDASARPDVGSRGAFHFLMATSGVTKGGAAGVEHSYRPYVSKTHRVGITVPILYLRTTKGPAVDWVFDADFDTDRKCGDRRLVDDNLDSVIRYAIEKQLPVQFALNGGIWADAACDVPEWDINDHLEKTVSNCQWTQDDKVYPDDYLKNLVGSTASPELGRSLTFNVFAREVRRYKKRNLQDAARRIAEFGRAHPELLVGVNLDSDTYMNPFFEQREWFDYNPGTLRQFRQWLRGTGVYAGHRDADLPDLRAWRRPRQLTLSEVNRLAGRNWTSWDSVEPPRKFPGSEHQPAPPGAIPIWDDPWYREWDTFRKHLVALHYDELAQWTYEAGIPKQKIFSSQGFVAPEGNLRPFAVHIESSGQNYDSAGVSIEGSVPRSGHLGAILYGPAAENRVRMEHRHGLFATFARIDPGWAVVEANMADLKRPNVLPTYAQAYRSFRDMFNYDARQATMMAWNGSNGLYAGQPAYVSYTSWLNTPAEDAMRDHMVARANLPLGSRLWTFGTAQHADDDGWTGEGAQVTAQRAGVSLVPTGGSTAITLLSPADQVIRGQNAGVLVLGIRSGGEIKGIEVWAEAAPGSGWKLLGRADNGSADDSSKAGTRIPLRWPPDWGNRIIAERLKLQIGAHQMVEVDRVALLPPG